MSWHDVAEEGDVDKLRTLVLAGQDINQLNGDLDMTALMRAANAGKVGAVCFLILEGADASIRDWELCTALDYAKHNQAMRLQERANKGRSWIEQNPAQLDSKLNDFSECVQLLKDLRWRWLRGNAEIAALDMAARVKAEKGGRSRL